MIRLNFPPLTEERRKEYVQASSSTWPRTVASRCATCVATRASTSRRPRRPSEISADELERAEKELEKITHDHVELIDKAFGRKEQELLEV